MYFYYYFYILSLLSLHIFKCFLQRRMRRYVMTICVSPTQALERGPAQTSASPDEEAGPSGASEQGEADNMEVRGGRFSKSAEERQKMLKQRKEELLQQARRFVHTLIFSVVMHRSLRRGVGGAF